MVYLIHFEESFHHANHYIGFVDGDTDDILEARLCKHRNGTGSKLLRAVSNANIHFDVVRVWRDGDRNFERKLKNRKKARCLCPVCIESNIHENPDFYCNERKLKRTGP